MSGRENYIVQRGYKIKKVFANQILLLAFILLLILLSLFVPTFFSLNNILNIFRQSSAIGIIACAMTVVMIGGNIDLSVGSVVGLSGVLAISYLYRSLWLAILVPLLVAAVIGFLNGFVVVKFKVDSMIVTLGTLAIVRGLALLYTGGKMVDGILGSPYKYIGSGDFLGIPKPAIYFFLIAILLGLLMHKTKFGRQVFCIGNNFEASRAVGISAEKIRIITFILSAVFAAFSSILISSRLNTANPLTGNGYEFDAVTAVIVGGTSLLGGRGNLFKTILGVLFIAFLNNAMILLNLHFSFQYMMKASLLALFVYLDIKLRDF